MNYLSGNHLKSILQDKGFSFRDSSRALNLSSEEMNELLNSAKIERSLFMEINEKLKLGIEIGLSYTDYIDPKDI